MGPSRRRKSLFSCDKTRPKCHRGSTPVLLQSCDNSKVSFLSTFGARMKRPLSRLLNGPPLNLTFLRRLFHFFDRNKTNPVYNLLSRRTYREVHKLTGNTRWFTVCVIEGWTRVGPCFVNHSLLRWHLPFNWHHFNATGFHIGQADIADAV